MTAHPFVKAVGGKTFLLPEILPRLPAKIRTYYEPFVGGGAVFFALATEKRFERAVLTDANEELMAAYQMLSLNAPEVIQKLKAHAKAHCEEYYYDVRAQKPSRLSMTSRAARLIYLNKSCFNGLWRVNKKGEFNVPFGKYKNPTICDEENLYAVSDTLREARFAAIDFAHVAFGAKPGDAVYFDCPYWPVSESANFVGYTKGGFTSDDQKRLRDCALRLKMAGVHILLSNADVPPVRALYAKDFTLHEVSAPRRVNSKGDRRGLVGELLIM